MGKVSSIHLGADSAGEISRENARRNATDELSRAKPHPIHPNVASGQEIETRRTVERIARELSQELKGATIIASLRSVTVYRLASGRTKIIERRDRLDIHQNAGGNS